jgi:excisionase family DNA binding protein
MTHQSQQTPAPALLGEAILNAIRQAVREEIQGLSNSHKDQALLTPEELADKLKLPISWVYEQSRQGNIPTHRLGKYIRFNLAEVIHSQKKNGEPS